VEKLRPDQTKLVLILSFYTDYVHVYSVLAYQQPWIHLMYIFCICIGPWWRFGARIDKVVLCQVGLILRLVTDRVHGRLRDWVFNQATQPSHPYVA